MGIETCTCSRVNGTELHTFAISSATSEKKKKKPQRRGEAAFLQFLSNILNLISVLFLIPFPFMLLILILVSHPIPTLVPCSVLTSPGLDSQFSLFVPFTTLIPMPIKVPISMGQMLESK
ncbi:hypothetical protein EVAR_56883_1 [Eumeta japonica]|uniref:Transmembrane protein n=1 Tax=Eumeta variegata TaxID=151549 RepID=A0A4C1ZBR1_EUMVA|nr:hypothetical protein EVAR_56883_1 [Eumeta japonica]